MFYLGIALSVHCLQLVLCLFLGWNNLLILNFFSCGFYVLLLFLQKNHRTTAMILGEIEICLFSAVSSFLCGWDAGFYLYAFGMLAASFLLSNFFCTKFGSINFLVDFTTLLFLIIRRSSFSVHLNGVDSSLDYLYFSVFVFNALATSTIILFTIQIFSYSMHRQNEKLKAMNRELEYISLHDSLTGLRNRRCSRLLFKKYQRLAAESSIPYCVAIGDIDNFKEYNDLYGHSFGDQVLFDVAQTLSASVKLCGHVFRWGGEEFLFLFPNTHKETAEIALQHVRQNLEKLCCKSYPNTKRITMTFGLAEFREDITIDQLISEADRNLYKGKTGTKNCIVD